MRKRGFQGAVVPVGEVEEWVVMVDMVRRRWVRRVVGVEAMVGSLEVLESVWAFCRSSCGIGMREYQKVQLVPERLWDLDLGTMTIRFDFAGAVR